MTHGMMQPSAVEKLSTGKKFISSLVSTKVQTEKVELKDTKVFSVSNQPSPLSNIFTMHPSKTAVTAFWNFEEGHVYQTVSSRKPTEPPR